MKTTTVGSRGRRRETGFRMPEDQQMQLDLIVALSNGRKNRSNLIIEAIDEFIAARRGRLKTAA